MTSAWPWPDGQEVMAEPWRGCEGQTVLTHFQIKTSSSYEKRPLALTSTGRFVLKDDFLSARVLCRCSLAPASAGGELGTMTQR